MNEPAATAPVDEDLYRQSLDRLKSPRPVPVTSLVFVILMLVFVAGVFTNLRSVSGVLLLVAVVIVHEAGHALGMRVFGFRDVRMFFIPFFGAAVSGRPRGAAAWKDAMVSLLGPLPGLVAGVVLLLVASRQPHPSALPFQAVEVLIVLNAFNLLPLGFLDGGRFFGRVLFSRHRVLEVVFQALGYLLLGWIAVQGGMWILGLFTLMALAGLPGRWRTLTAAAALRRRMPGLDPDPDRLGDAEGRAVFAAAGEALRHPANPQPAAMAEAMESVLDAMRRAPGVLATLGLLLLYAFGLLCAAVGIVVLSIHVGPVEWQVVERARWRAEFPRPPLEAPGLGATGADRDTSWRTAVDGTDRFTITVSEVTGNSAWRDTATHELARATHTTFAGSRPVAIAGLPATEYEFTAPRRVVRVRLLEAGGWRYQVTASAPKWGESQRRFLESFAVRDSLP